MKVVISDIECGLKSTDVIVGEVVVNSVNLLIKKQELIMSTSGKMDAEVFRNGISVNKYSSTKVSGSDLSFESNQGLEGISMRFEPAVIDGPNTYEFKASDYKFQYNTANGTFDITGKVEVMSKNSTDNMEFKFSGKFMDGRKELTIEGTGSLNYKFP